MSESWKVLNLDLSDGVPSLPQEDGSGGIYIIFWWHGVPLGHCEVGAEYLPMSARQLEQKALENITPAVGDRLFRHGFKAPLPDTPQENEPADLQALVFMRRPLAALQKQQQEARARVKAATPNVSLVICTRDRPQDLQRCLASLRSLTLRPQQILVVDNSPETEATRHLVLNEAGIEYVPEAQPGLSRARNAGIAHSRGEIVVFTDDDVVVHPDWLLDLLQGFEDPHVMAVTGPVLPAELETAAQVAFQQGQLNCGWGYRQLDFDANFFQHTRNNGSPCGASELAPTWLFASSSLNRRVSLTNAWAPEHPGAAKTRKCGIESSPRAGYVAINLQVPCSTITGVTWRA
jgi:hypothetical protein